MAKKRDELLEEDAPKKRKKKRRKPVEQEIEEEDAEEDELFQFSEDQGTQRGLTVIFFFALAILSFLAFIDAAGDLGGWIDTGLGWLFGWGRYMMPIFFAVLGYVLLHPDRYAVRAVNWIGSILFLLSSLALLQLIIPLDESIQAPEFGKGGGLVGVLLGYPLHKFAGIVAAVVVLVALFTASLLMMFETSLDRLLASMSGIKILAKPITWLRSHLHARMNGYNMDGDEEDDYEDEYDEEEPEEEIAEEEFSGAFTQTELDERIAAASTNPDELEQLQFVPVAEAPKKRHKKIDLPIELLTEGKEKPTSGDIEGNKQNIQNTLESFGIDVDMEEVNVGPMVTQFTLKPAQGVKLTQITALQNDIALALAAHPIRIEAPIPGKAAVGIEVPNKATATVRIREVISSKEFKKRPDNLSLAVGKDVSGKTAVVSVAKMPHVLIAGATGSGKSVCINALILSLLYQNSPDDLKFIMVDPKRVELSVYNGIPHLLTPVITDVEKTVNSLKWAVAEMDRRYEVLARVGKRNIESYNESVSSDEKMPYIVFIIDELADLMAVAANSVEAAIVRLAQMSRAVGIHLVLATQRPSVNVITGLIKANMPARIAFAVTSLVDSRTILDFAGAEKLLGRGDMLYIDATLSKPRRYQGAFVDEGEIEKVVEYLKEAGGEPEYNSDVTEKMNVRGVPGMVSDGMADNADGDEHLEEAKNIIMQAGKASASLLQRRLRVGYARAARILDILEEQGFIGPAEGSKPREILATETDLGEAPDEEDDGEYEDDGSDEETGYDDNEDEYEDDEEQEPEEGVTKRQF